MNKNKLGRIQSFAHAFLIGMLISHATASLADTLDECTHLVAGTQVKISRYRNGTTTDDIEIVRLQIEDALNAVRATGLNLPGQIEVEVNMLEFTWESFYRAGDPPFMLTSRDPNVVFHELGHILFVSNLPDESIPYLQAMKSAEEEKLRLETQFRVATESFAAHGSTEGDTLESEAFSQLRREYLTATFKLQPQLIESFFRTDFFRAYDELLADTFAFAMTGLKCGNCQPEEEWSLEKQILPEKSKAILRAARNFDADLTPEDWGNEWIHLNPYIFFGPVRSFIGKNMPKNSTAERLLYFTKVYRAAVDDMAEHLVGRPDIKALGARDTVEANRKLIDRIERTTLP